LDVIYASFVAISVPPPHPGVCAVTLGFVHHQRRGCAHRKYELSVAGFKA
jgi:hypothetical protein